MPKLVEVVVKATGDTQVVPERWLDHPVLGKPFERPEAKDQDPADPGTETAAGSEPSGIPVEHEDRRVSKRRRQTEGI